MTYVFPWSRYRHLPPSDSHAATSNDGLLDVRLAVSSDGERFEYVSSETFIDRGIGELGPKALACVDRTCPDWHFEGEWDSGIMFAVRGYVETNSSLVLFYWGTQMTHGAYPKIWAYPEAAAGVGRLTLRKNGWFSFDSGGEIRTLTTTAVVVPPKPAALQVQLVVRLNVLSSVRGTVRLELLGATSGSPLPGYDLNSSKAVTGWNSLAAPLMWQAGAPTLSEKQSVVLRFEATDSKIFSFELDWVPPPPPIVHRHPVSNVDIAGGFAAYNHSYVFGNQTDHALVCVAQCDADGRCKAWTYVSPGGGKPGEGTERCCFFASVGCPRSMKGITSGAKADGPCTR